jgi:hypothetical protein
MLIYGYLKAFCWSFIHRMKNVWSKLQKSITYSECVLGALLDQHAMRMRSIIAMCVLSSFIVLFHIIS